MTELTPVYTFQGSKWSFTLNCDHTIYLLNSIPKREKKSIITVSLIAWKEHDIQPKEHDKYI